MRSDAVDMALAALALVEHSVDDNQAERAALLNTTDTGDLIIGLTVLAGSLRCSLAAAWGITTERLDQLLREQYLTNAAALDFGGEVA